MTISRRTVCVIIYFSVMCESLIYAIFNLHVPIKIGYQQQKYNIRIYTLQTIITPAKSSISYNGLAMKSPFWRCKIARFTDELLSHGLTAAGPAALHASSPSCNFSFFHVQKCISLIFLGLTIQYCDLSFC